MRYASSYEKTMVLAVMVAAVGLLGLISGPAMGQTSAGPTTPIAGTTAPVGTLRISLTNQGPVTSSDVTIPGLYNVTVTNNSSRRRGVELTGIDLCCTIYKRFSSVLRVGQSQTFKWYFAPGKVTFREFSGARKTGRAYTNVRYTGNSTSMTFQ